MKKFTDNSLKSDFALIAKASNNNSFDIEVGANDYQISSKDSSIGVSKDVSRNSISGYIDMGDCHAVFNYKKNLMSQVVDLVRDMDVNLVKSVKLFMPKRSEVLDFNRKPQSTYGFKMTQIENSLFLKGIDYEISNEIFTAPKIASVPSIKPSVAKYLPKVA